MLLLTSIVFTNTALADSFPVTITDVAGRTITLNSQPKNIALSTGRVFPLLEIIYQKEAANHLVAWRDDMRLSAPSMYANYIHYYPQLKNVMKIGKIKSGEFDTERFISMKNKPDLFVVDISNIKLAKEKGLIAKLDRVGIKVLAIDFSANPIKNTLRSVTSLAKALGKKDQGQQFADYYQSHVNYLKKIVNSLPDHERHKKVFIERAAGYLDSCCNTFAKGNMGSYIPFLNAINIADKPLNGAKAGQMSMESIIQFQPDVYIMQTTGWINKDGKTTGGIPFGYAPTNSMAIKSATHALMDRTWIKATKAYENKNVYSIYMPFYNSPYNLVAMEYFAKWLHPKQFNDLNPQTTFEEMNQRFANRTVTGIFGQNNNKVVK